MNRKTSLSLLTILVLAAITVWEGGHRVPFLVRWPGTVPEGSSSSMMICHNDLLATMAELTGQSLDWNAGEDSFSFLSALTGEKSDWGERHTMINQAVSTTLAIRKDNWKLILDKSSGERHNLYHDKPEKVAELEALIHTYRKEGRSRFK